MMDIVNGWKIWVNYRKRRKQIKTHEIQRKKISTVPKVIKQKKTKTRYDSCIKEKKTRIQTRISFK